MEKFNKNTILHIHLPLLIVQITFGSLSPFTKLALKYFTPFSVVFFRVYFTALLFASIFFLYKKEKIMDIKHFAWLALFGFFGVAGNQLFYVTGVSITTAVNAGILQTTIPIFTLIVAIFLRKEELTPIKIAGTLIAISGVAYLIDFGRFHLNGNIWGDLFLLCNSCFYAVYLVISKRMLAIYNSFTVITYVFLFAAVMILPFTISSVASINYSTIPANGYAALLMVLIFGTVVPYAVVTFALRKTQSSSVAIYSYLQPLIASVLSALVVGETITVKIIISAFIIILGVSFVTFAGIFRFNKILSRIKGFIE